MLKNKYLYKNIMLTNKVNRDFIWVWKGKYKVMLSRRVLTGEFDKAFEGHTTKDIKELV